MTTPSPREPLLALRTELLSLHRELIASERGVYERTFGQIASPTAFLHLLTTDKWFAWLLPFTALVGKIDGALADKKQPVTQESAKALIAETRALLTPDEHGEGFAKLYFESLHRDPHVAVAHADFNRQFAKLPAEFRQI
ncbi:MAG: uncharacterized protein JWO82_1135 [Akkermansiaceae bacterium]|nr:uncharacterized protein [Akkermansiaceae bacterium]